MTKLLCSAPRAVHCSKLRKECRPNRKSAFSLLPGNCSTRLRKLSVGWDHLQFVNAEDSQLPCPGDLRPEVCTRNWLRIFLRNSSGKMFSFFGAMSATFLPTILRATTAWPMSRCSRSCPFLPTTFFEFSPKGPMRAKRPRPTSRLCATSFVPLPDHFQDLI